MQGETRESKITAGGETATEEGETATRKGGSGGEVARVVKGATRKRRGV